MKTISSILALIIVTAIMVGCEEHERWQDNLIREFKSSIVTKIRNSKDNLIISNFNQYFRDNYGADVRTVNYTIPSAYITMLSSTCQLYTSPGQIKTDVLVSNWRTEVVDVVNLTQAFEYIWSYQRNGETCLASEVDDFYNNGNWTASLDTYVDRWEIDNAKIIKENFSMEILAKNTTTGEQEVYSIYPSEVIFTCIEKATGFGNIPCSGKVYLDLGGKLKKKSSTSVK